MTIRGDSTEYELLKIWCETLPFYEEPKSVKTCEIGVREGLGSQLIIMTIKGRIGKIPYEHIGIDPYNDAAYQHYDNTTAYKSDYNDAMRVQLLKDFSDNENFKLHHCTDIEYMNSNSKENLIFDLVYFDGPHKTQDVIREAVWFADRSRKGTRFIFDDFRFYTIEDVAKLLAHWGFNIIGSGASKICLQRMN